VSLLYIFKLLHRAKIVIRLATLREFIFVKKEIDFREAIESRNFARNIYTRYFFGIKPFLCKIFLKDGKFANLRKPLVEMNRLSQ